MSSPESSSPHAPQTPPRIPRSPWPLAHPSRSWLPQSPLGGHGSRSNSSPSRLPVDGVVVDQRAQIPRRKKGRPLGKAERTPQKMKPSCWSDRRKLVLGLRNERSPEFKQQIIATFDQEHVKLESTQTSAKEYWSHMEAATGIGRRDIRNICKPAMRQKVRQFLSEKANKPVSGRKKVLEAQHQLRAWCAYGCRWQGSQDSAALV